MHRLTTLLFFTILFFTHHAYSQNTGWDKVDKQLSEASNDSTRILAYYKVASEIYRSNPQEAQEIVSKGLSLISEKNSNLCKLIY
ncbi:hypothetical protein [Sphingobacterium siyangense]|uniref:hypothetical protein n=1 Tax=Sphingobacterium siyangense TaxID=459529 RepID=UPI003DA3704F